LEHLDNLQQAIGITFSNVSLIEEALTHSSYINENHKSASNERLEFLGDAVLGLILAQKLFQDYPELEEGDLTRLRSWLVRRSTLANVAKSINMGSYLLMGKGEESSGGRAKSSNLAGAMEAVIAAVFLDQGWENTREAIFRLFNTEMERLRHEQSAQDYKSQIQEMVQALYKLTPSYRIVNEAGPDHARQFTAEIMAGEEVLAQGNGRSKKLAEAEAARLALEKTAGTFTD
jgi:ribonuclease-3